jgi:hypothetical protein
MSHFRRSIMSSRYRKASFSAHVAPMTKALIVLGTLAQYPIECQTVGFFQLLLLPVHKLYAGFGYRRLWLEARQSPDSQVIWERSRKIFRALEGREWVGPQPLIYLSQQPDWRSTCRLLNWSLTQTTQLTGWLEPQVILLSFDPMSARQADPGMGAACHLGGEGPQSELGLPEKKRHSSSELRLTF